MAGAGRTYSVIGLPGAGAAPTVVPAGARPPRPPRHAPLPVAPGDTVRHDRFGEGVVLSVSGEGEDAEARVAFSEAGEKNLLLAYAPLEKVGG
jgi:hypothetical protein